MELPMSGDVSKKKAAGEGAPQPSCCRVQSIVSVDERGQMVLPKEIREQAGIKPGDKLAVVSMERDGKVCCITLMKIDALTDVVKGVLGPVMKDIL
jgi:AbrB family looped-hinge helix DNA binding protein